jgi:6-phosphogluconolactonase
MSRDVDIRVVDDPAQAAAELLADAARNGRRIALSGGTTPRHAYGLAAGLEPDWSRAEVWFADDRCVPPDDERSNYRLVRETLLDRLERAPKAVHRILGNYDPDQAAAAYDAELRAAGPLDLVLLGIGPDGHTASLFPNAPTLEERERLAVAAEGLGLHRVTLTRPALEAAGALAFLVTGDDKAEAVRRAFAAPPSADTPASLVRAASGPTIAILDAAAASRLG